MSGEKIGEYIDIIREHDSDEEYVRGHVGDGVAVAVIELAIPRVAGSTRHTWARRVPDSTGDYSMKFEPCDKVPGAFAVTEVKVTKLLAPCRACDQGRANAGPGLSMARHTCNRPAPPVDAGEGVLP